MSLTRKKSLRSLLDQASHSDLKRTLTAKSLVALGIGAIIGAGLFVRTAAASAEAAGPSVILSFVVAATGCLLGGAIPFQWSHSPLEVSDAGIRGIINGPALIILLLLTALLIKGTQESA